MPSAARTGTAAPSARPRAWCLAPHVPTVGAPVTADYHDQGRGPPHERFVRQLPGHAVPSGPFATVATAPPVGPDHPAGQHRAVGFKSLAGDREPELVEPVEGG